MPNFVLDQNASDINDAINRAHNPNTSPTSGITDKFVTSDGIYQALQDLDASNFSDAALIEDDETWVSSNTKVATTAAIANYVASTGGLATGFTQLGTTSASGTAASDGFIIAKARGSSNTNSRTSVTVAGIEFENDCTYYASGGNSSTCVPIAAGETYSATAEGNNSRVIYFKALT